MSLAENHWLTHTVVLRRIQFTDQTPCCIINQPWCSIIVSVCLYAWTPFAQQRPYIIIRHACRRWKIYASDGRRTDVDCIAYMQLLCNLVRLVIVISCQQCSLSCQANDVHCLPPRRVTANRRLDVIAVSPRGVFRGRYKRRASPKLGKHRLTHTARIMRPGCRWR